MPVPSIFNENISPAIAGDNTIIPAAGADKKIRVMEMAIQNLDNSTSVRIEVKAGSDIVIGPLLVQPGALLNLDLPSWEDKPYMYLPDNTALILNSSEVVELTVFGYADIV